VRFHILFSLLPLLDCSRRRELTGFRIWTGARRNATRRARLARRTSIGAAQLGFDGEEDGQHGTYPSLSSAPLPPPLFERVVPPPLPFPEPSTDLVVPLPPVPLLRQLRRSQREQPQEERRRPPRSTGEEQKCECSREGRSGWEGEECGGGEGEAEGGAAEEDECVASLLPGGQRMTALPQA